MWEFREDSSNLFKIQMECSNGLKVLSVKLNKKKNRNIYLIVV